MQTVLQREFRRRLFDVVMTVAIDADRIGEIDLFREVPIVRTAFDLLGLLAVALGTARHVGAELGADETEFLFVGFRILFAVSAVAVGARHPLQIVNAAGEILHGSGQFTSGRQMAADAVRFHVRHRVARLPPFGKLHVGVGIARREGGRPPLSSTRPVSRQADFRQPLPVRGVLPKRETPTQTATGITHAMKTAKAASGRYIEAIPRQGHQIRRHKIGSPLYAITAQAGLQREGARAFSSLLPPRQVYFGVHGRALAADKKRAIIRLSSPVIERSRKDATFPRDCLRPPHARLLFRNAPPSVPLSPQRLCGRARRTALDRCGGRGAIRHPAQHPAPSRQRGSGSRAACRPPFTGCFFAAPPARVCGSCSPSGGAVLLSFGRGRKVAERPSKSAFSFPG